MAKKVFARRNNNLNPSMQAPLRSNMVLISLANNPKETTRFLSHYNLKIAKV